MNRHLLAFFRLRIAHGSAQYFGSRVVHMLLVVGVVPFGSPVRCLFAGWCVVTRSHLMFLGCILLALC
jgi:hypothetical protein